MMRIYDLKNFKVVEEVYDHLNKCPSILEFSTSAYRYIGDWKCCSLRVDSIENSYNALLRQYKESRLLLLAEPGTDVSKMLPEVKYMILTEKTSGRLHAEPSTDMQSMQPAG